jgi:hypothetical protein
MGQHSNYGKKSWTLAFSRYHVTPRIHATMAAQCPMFIIRRAEYFQYIMLYKYWIICWNWFSLLCSLSAFCDWILKHFTSLYIGIVIYSIIEICWNHFILTNSIALPSAVYYFVASDKSSAFLFWNSQAGALCTYHIYYFAVKKWYSIRLLNLPCYMFGTKILV